MRPEGTDGKSDDDLESELQAQLAAADTLEVEPYEDEVADVPLMAAIPTAGSITSEEAIESIDAVKWTLSNGITVIAKQTDFKNDEVIFGAFSPGGHSLVDDADHVSALYAATLISGQRRRSARQRDRGQAARRQAGFPFRPISASCSRASTDARHPKTWKRCFN